MTVGRLHIEIPEELHRRLKLRAVKQDTSLKDLVVDLLEEAK